MFYHDPSWQQESVIILSAASILCESPYCLLMISSLQMPGFDVVHTLSISHEAITALSFNQKGDWLAVGSAALGQLLVWEWRSETYVLKQQGHYHDISTVAYSPDGAYIATGADDAKVSIFTFS